MYHISSIHLLKDIFVFTIYDFKFSINILCNFLTQLGKYLIMPLLSYMGRLWLVLYETTDLSS